jgi:hypothetical protein
MKISVQGAAERKLSVGDVIDVAGDSLANDMRLVVESNAKYHAVSLNDGRAIMSPYNSLEDLWQYYENHHEPKILQFKNIVLEEK